MQRAAGSDSSSAFRVGLQFFEIEKFPWNVTLRIYIGLYRDILSYFQVFVHKLEYLFSPRSMKFFSVDLHLYWNIVSTEIVSTVYR